MKNAIRFSALVMCVVVGIGAAHAEEASYYAISAQLYSVSGSFKASSSETPSGKELHPWECDQFELAGTVLHLNGDALEWSGTSIDENDSVDLLALPNIMTLPDHEATINITQEIPMQMLKPVDSEDDSTKEYELATVHVEKGIVLTATPGTLESDPKKVRLETELTLKIPDGNTLLEGTELEAGPIRMHNINSQTTLGLTPGQWTANFIKTEDDTHILILLKVDLKEN